jgi:hypothetical protein
MVDIDQACLHSSTFVLYGISIWMMQLLVVAHVVLFLQLNKHFGLKLHVFSPN